MKRILPSLVVLAFLFATTAARADQSPQIVVDHALATYSDLTSDPNFASLNKLLKRAKAIIIVPQMVKGGFIIGAEYGPGVLLARDPANGTWSPPAFVTLGSGSIGLQIGGSVSQVILVVMTDKGLQAMLQDKMTLGGEASIAAGPVGGGIDAQSTSDINDDVFAYAKSKGLFAGVAFKGGVIQPDAERIKAYYGKAYTARQIVLDRAATNPGADALRAALGKG